MKVRILRNLVYADFAEGKSKARKREEGEIVNFPEWYAESLIKSGLAEPADERMGESADEPVSDEPKEQAKPRRKRKKE